MRDTWQYAGVVRILALAAIGCLALSPAQAQTVAPDFVGSYTLTNLGAVTGLPTPYGGMTFVDSDTILIGGDANRANGRLYTIDVARDVQGHITGFVGTAAQYGQVGTYNDGGVVFGPGGVLFAAQWPVMRLGQTKPGSTVEDKVTSLSALGMGDGPGGVAFVPAGMPGAGQLKMVSYYESFWYTVAYAPDGLGTYTLSSPVANVTLSGGPEGIAYVPLGSVLFPNPSVLVSEYLAGSIGVYEVDASGNPIKASRRTFVSGLTGAEGAVIDPITGDFLFSTFGGGDKVVRVTGFHAPTPVQITGAVRDPAAVPLAGVTMHLTGSILRAGVVERGTAANPGRVLQSVTSQPVTTLTTTTAADGTYTFTGLPAAGTYTVTPLASGRLFTPLSRTFANITTDQTGDFVGTLVYQISGQVRDLNDTGVASVTMTLSGSQSGTLTTDLDGRYVFTNLPVAGTYTVTPTKGTFQFLPPSQTFANLQKDEVAGFFVAEVGTFTRYFAEGATSDFFDTQIALLNATGRPTTATVRFQRQAPAPEVVKTVNLDGIQRVTIDPKWLGLTTAEFSTVIESTQPVIADRTITWDETAYGSHAETSIGRPLTRWYLAEGATISGFDLFYLIQNPGTSKAEIQVQYLLPAPLAPITKPYSVDPLSRFNIWVNKEGGPLGAAEVSAVITSTNDVPVIVERAMYRQVGTQFFGAGHESAGVEAPALQWYFAEGATGPYFDLFFLAANPNSVAIARRGAVPQARRHGHHTQLLRRSQQPLQRLGRLRGA